jgi:hypothetical protein
MRYFAKAQGVSEADALEKGMEVKAIEFVKKGSEVYQKVRYETRKLLHWCRVRDGCRPKSAPKSKFREAFRFGETRGR